MKLCIACSAGGHLTEIMLLEDLFKKHNHFFLTFERSNSKYLVKKERVYFVKDPTRNPISLLITILQSMIVFIKERPNAIISNGAGVAVPICYLMRVFGKKVLFIESFCRLKPSLSGKVIYPIASLFIVQWPRMRRYYKKAVYAGSLI